MAEGVGPDFLLVPDTPHAARKDESVSVPAPTPAYLKRSRRETRLWVRPRNRAGSDIGSYRSVILLPLLLPISQRRRRRDGERVLRAPDQPNPFAQLRHGVGAQVL